MANTIILACAIISFTWEPTAWGGFELLLAVASIATNGNCAAVNLLSYIVAVYDVIYAFRQ